MEAPRLGRQARGQRACPTMAVRHDDASPQKWGCGGRIMMGAWLLMMARSFIACGRNAPEATQGALVTLPAVRPCRPFQCPRGGRRQTRRLDDAPVKP